MSESIVRHSGRREHANHRLNAGHPGVYKAKQHFDREQATKLADREDRIGMAAERSPEEQLARLDTRLGAGFGASRERERLATRIAAQRGSQSVVEAVSAIPAKRKLTAEEKAARKSAKEVARATALAAHNAQNTAGK